MEIDPLRAQFAAAVVQGMLANSDLVRVTDSVAKSAGVAPSYLIAAMAATQADDLIKALNEIPDPSAALVAARDIIEVVENAMRRHDNLPSYLHNKCIEALKLLPPQP
jgi:hypothetical protein